MRQKILTKIKKPKVRHFYSQIVARNPQTSNILYLTKSSSSQMYLNLIVHKIVLC